MHVIKEKINENIVETIKRILYIIAAISTILELILFPSLPNVMGCIMMWIALLLYNLFVFNRQNFVNTPFSSTMMISVFMYHFLPVPGTLIALRPVSFGMENPYRTFTLEIILFIVACIAFMLAKYRIKGYSIFRKLLNTFGVYNEVTPKMVWICTILAVFFKLLRMAGMTKGIITKILDPMEFFVYTPVILFFPCLYQRNSYSEINFKKKSVWVYIAAITVVNIASNSRNAIIAPVCVILLLLFIAIIYTDIKPTILFSVKNLMIFLVLGIIFLQMFSMISKAMLLSRNVRDDLSALQLFEYTVDLIQNEKLDDYWVAYRQLKTETYGYESGWIEEYTGNTLLERFCNVRITDEVLYFADNQNDTIKSILQEDFYNRILAMFPGPFVELIDPTFDKSEYENSRGDKLYSITRGNSLSLGNYRVTSHVADGILTFGPIYFLLQLVMWTIVMRLLNSYTLFDKNGNPIYSACALINIYSIMIQFTNANGILMDVEYTVRGFWQELLLYILFMGIVRILARFRLGQ